MRVHDENRIGTERRQYEYGLESVGIERRSGEDQRALQSDNDIDRSEWMLAEPYFSAMSRRRKARDKR